MAKFNVADLCEDAGIDVTNMGSTEYGQLVRLVKLTRIHALMNAREHTTFGSVEYCQLTNLIKETK